MGRIARPALARRLAAAVDSGSLLLVAPAGCGKTVALEEGLRLRGGAAAWLRCSEADRDPGWLLSHVVDAVRGAVPGVADAIEEGLAGAPGQIDVAHAVGALLGELDRLLVDPLTIVIDDAEQLGDGDAVELVDRLLAAEVPALRVAVASRRPLELRIARLRLPDLGASDLAFSVEECAQLLSEVREPADGEVETLWAATEGWPLGVSLGARSDHAARGLAASSDALSTFLDEELLAALGPDLRSEVIDSSVAPAMDPALAAALGLSEGFIEEVHRRGVPLRVLPGDGEQVAYHPLVRDLLLERFARERPPARQLEVHACVARALEAAGRPRDAVEHWLEAGDPAAAAAVAIQGQALANTAPGTVGDWLERLPAEARTAPELCLLEGRLAAGAGRLEEAVAPLRAALTGFEARGESQASWIARIALADTCAIQEAFESVIPLAEGFEASDSPLAPMVGMAAGAALAGVGRFGEAADLLARAAAHPQGAPLAPLVAGFRGLWVDLQCGRLDAALAGAREAVAMLERADPAQRLPYVIGFVAMIQDERGELAAALSTMERAERISEQYGVGGYITPVARRFRAGASARAGRLTEAEAELASAGELRHGWHAGDAELTRATIAARRGAQAEACDFVGEALNAGALTRWRSRWRTTALLAPVLVDAGRPTWARELVEDALAVRPPLACCDRLLVLRGWLRSREGDETGALEDLLRAWEEAGEAPEHLVRRERPRVEPLLWTALERGMLAPEAATAALEAAVPGGDSLLSFTRHPVPEVRRAAVLAAAGSGHPEAAARIGELEGDTDPVVAKAARAARARVVAEPPPLMFKVLGGFALRRGAFAVGDDAWGRLAALRLVRFLLVHRGAVVPEDELFDAFWPDRAAGAARHSLQVALSSARAVLDPPGAQRSVVAVTNRSYRLELRPGDIVDADEFEAAASAALGVAGAERATQLELAAARWGGEPLPEDRYETWATVWRERLTDLYGRVLGELAETCSAAGDRAGAVDAARRAVGLDALDEAAQRRLILAYARAGRRGHALRQYLACRRALVDELGVEPSAETIALQRRVLAGDAL